MSRSSASLLAELAQSRLDKRTKRYTNTGESLLDFEKRITPQFERPVHLTEAAEMLQQALVQPIRFLFSAPPRHGKSQLLFHLMAMYLARFPDRLMGYASYAADIAESKSLEIQSYAERAGVKIKASKRGAGEWRTEQGGGLIAVGVNGPFTGHGFYLVVVDDPHRNRAEAESPTMRKKIHEWFTSTAINRLEPGGSAIVTHCIAKGEPVLMADGSWRAVEDVKPCESVRSYDGTRFVNRRVAAARLSGHDPILKVTTKRKSLRVNARHPFLLDTGKWKAAGVLQSGDSVVVCNQGSGDVEVDPEFAWLFGFMIGDGWVTTWKHGRSMAWCVCVAKKAYPDRNERVQAAFEKFFGRRPRETTAGYYRLDSAEVGRRLTALGLTGGAWGKRIPEWAFWLTPALKTEFLRGYIASDGNRLKKCVESYRVASVSEALLEDTRLLALSAGLHATKVTHASQMVQAPHSAALKLSTIFSVTINFNIDPERAEEIQAVVPDGTEDVYDLTVEGTENFIANGFVVHNTRWTQDDEIGTLQKNTDAAWEYRNYPALSPTGEALWPDRWPTSALQKRRIDVGEYDWASMFMGEPRPRGAGVFHGTHLYERLPTDGNGKPVPLTLSVGLDLAYTAKTYSDWSVAIVLGKAPDGTIYVLDLLMEQLAAPAFIEKLKRLLGDYSWPPVFSYIGGQEQGIADFFQTQGVKVNTEHAKADKFVRAQGVAAAWNQGLVKIPANPKFPLKKLNTAVSEIASFTGVGDTHDDVVDALAGGYAQLTIPPPARGVGQQPLFPY